MTLHRIEHAVVMDTDDIPGRGGYAVVGISSGVTQAERAFVAGNFGISDYLHDPKTEDRVFYSFFRVPGGRRAFVRRFSRGNELRRNKTQRRLIVQTLFIDDDVYRALYGLPWLLLNARDVLRRDLNIDHEGTVLAPLEWNTDDGAATGVAARLGKRLDNLGGRASLVARTITALSERTRVVLPQDSAHEWITVLAWSMLPWRDREELAWTQHDTMNIAGVPFPLANATSEPPTTLPVAASFATELVEMNVASEDSWRDLQERTARHPLTVRKAHELDAWLDWRAAIVRLQKHDLRTPDHEVIEDMRQLASTTQQNPSAAWIDGEEVLQLIWPNVPAAIAQGQPAELAVKQWGGRLQQSGLGPVIFRAAPNVRWLDRAAKDVGADALVWFFLLGTEGDAASKPTRTAIAEWLIESNVRDVSGARLARLAFRLAADKSPAMPRLLERLLETNEGLVALHELLKDWVGDAARNDTLREGAPHPNPLPTAMNPPRREGTVVPVPSPLVRGEGARRADEGLSFASTWASGGDLVFAAVPIALKRAHPATLPFLRDVFLPRVDRSRVTASLARDVADVLRDDPPSFVRFAARVSPEVAGELMALVTQWVFRDPQRSVPLAREVLRQVHAIETAGPLAIALASAGEPAQVWFDVMLQIARSTDAKYDSGATREFVRTLQVLGERPLNLDGAMDLFLGTAGVPPGGQDARSPGDSTRALILLLRPMWASGESRFADALVSLIERSARATAWEEIVAAYATDHARTRRDDVSRLVAAFWMKVDPASVTEIAPRTIELLHHVTGRTRERFAAFWSKKVQQLPDSPAAERLLEFVEQKTPQMQAELALRDVRQGTADARTLNRLDASLFKLHGKKYVDTMATALETYAGKGEGPARVVRMLELIESPEILPTVRLVLQRRVLPRAVKALSWRERRKLQGMRGDGALPV